MTLVFTNWGTDAAVRAAILSLAMLAAVPAAYPARDADDPVRHPRDLEAILRDAEKSLSKAERALRGRDPGRVSLLLRRTEEELTRFERASGLEGLINTLTTCAVAAREENLATARDELKRIRPGLLLLSDYSVTRDAEVGYRLALRAADAGDADAYLKALARLESAILAPALLASIHEGSEAIARGRSAMVRRDMAAGREEAAVARRALDSLRYAAALSHSLLGLQVAAELLEENVRIAAKEQARNGLRKLRTAIELAPAGARTELEKAHSDATVIWRRMSRPEPDDAARLKQISHALEAIRQPQGVSP